MGRDQRGIICDMKVKTGLLGGDRGPEGEGRRTGEDPLEEGVYENAIMKSILYASF